MPNPSLYANTQPNANIFSKDITPVTPTHPQLKEIASYIPYPDLKSSSRRSSISTNSEEQTPGAKPSPNPKKKDEKSQFMKGAFSFAKNIMNMVNPKDEPKMTKLSANQISVDFLNAEAQQLDPEY